MKINHLTSAEENLMRLLWKLGSFYLKDIMEQHPEPKPHQNTVSTYLKILTEKGYLSTEKEGRIFRYQTIVPAEEYRKFLLIQLSDNFFSSSGKEIVSFMVQEQLISADDLKDFNIDIDPVLKKEPAFEYANEILNPKKDKKKSKDKKKKKKKEKE
ncbi:MULTISPECIES: BlaI/MecI/CopY family transcriptional regulator [Chryseobacterium]|jgi:BlaI family penicillinase repressor|uniref:BlaI/MecI/CopY family transcriptional regulator n=1 Tax=Chryseobacterium nepalense TaxID=1854498 RepID=A0ABY4KAJ3_9FLAO|nr:MULTISPECIES: BlaI/MecI/CopY family transcriptional regulator [Chryseobacterium]MEA1849376.1 BlaI/MecI/CopY family transcriptional regulator [Chryseobacterium sp. MHB01]UPQ76552.1 BlaI/MecI/CopY family transcriptional regulator [Chryseobacterium nepalense]